MAMLFALPRDPRPKWELVGADCKCFGRWQNGEYVFWAVDYCQRHWPTT